MSKRIAIAALLCAANVAALAQQTPAGALVKACAGLVRHAPDITVSTPSKRAADMTLQREKGWKESHEVLVRVSDTPSVRVARDLKATGQRCQFSVSTDMQNVAVSKRACMALCLDEAMSSIDGTPSLAYVGVDGKREFLR